MRGKQSVEMTQAMISGCGSCCVLQIGEKIIHSSAALYHDSFAFETSWLLQQGRRCKVEAAII